LAPYTGVTVRAHMRHELLDRGAVLLEFPK
jgi:hypothetical protein